MAGSRRSRPAPHGAKIPALIESGVRTGTGPKADSERVQVLLGIPASCCKLRPLAPVAQLDRASDFETLTGPSPVTQSLRVFPRDQEGSELRWQELGHLQTREVGEVLEHAVRRIKRYLERRGAIEADDGVDAADNDNGGQLEASAVSGQVPPAGP